MFWVWGQPSLETSKTEVGIQVPPCLLKVKTSVGTQIFYWCFFFSRSSRLRSRVLARRKGNKGECKQNPFVKAFWCVLGVCFWRWSSLCHGLGVHNLCFFKVELNWRKCSRGTCSTPQPVMEIRSIGWHKRQSEINCPETHAGRVSGPLYQLFCFTDPILQHHITCPNLSFQYCTLLHWLNCHKAFLRGTYIGSSLENKDVIAGKSGTVWPLWSPGPALLLCHIWWWSPAHFRELEKDFGI